MSSGQINKILNEWFGGITGAMVVLLFYVFCILVNFQACLLIIVAFLKGPGQSWLASITWLDAVDAPRAEQWYMAVFMVIISVSYGT